MYTPATVTHCEHFRPSQDSCFSVTSLPLALLGQTCLLLPDLSRCRLLLPDASSSLPDLAAALLSSSSGGVLAASAAAACAVLLLRSSVARHRLERECAHLRRHLEDINQDKHYQVRGEDISTRMCALYCVPIKRKVKK